MAKRNKKSMSREEAAELYRDLKRTMSQMKTKYIKGAGMDASTKDAAKQIARAISEGMAREDQQNQARGSSPAPEMPLEPQAAFADLHSAGPASSPISGQYAALMLVFVFAVAKLVFSVLDASGIAEVQEAQASIDMRSSVSFSSPDFSKEEVRILTSLDERRQKLEERSKKIDQREMDIERRDREFAAKLTELRELTQRLKVDRDKSERKRDGQLDQLANVYGSMNPQESAQLIEQLDIAIALSLLERMPEKRIGQILSLMSPERALSITRMLSSGK